MSSFSTAELPPIFSSVATGRQRHNRLIQTPTAPPPGNTVRRRISTVTRKLSTTIGWRSSSVPIQDIVCKGKAMCGKYIKCRLMRSGVYSKKCTLHRFHSLAVAPADATDCRVFAVLLNIGLELEKMYPLLYVGVARQAGAGVIAADKTVNNVMAAVGKEMFRTHITWAKVVSLFAVAGGLAVDCVRHGHPEYLQRVIECTGEVLEEEVASWIAIKGGWSDLLTYYKPVTNDVSLVGFVGLLGAVIAISMVLVLLLRWFITFAMF